jgi:DNA-binding NarL/FixJ family response regulator
MESTTLPKPLSPQQKIIMQHLVDGLSYKEIALQMGVEARTIRTYLSRIRIKMGAKSNYRCIALLIAGGEVTVNPMDDHI